MLNLLLLLYVYREPKKKPSCFPKKLIDPQNPLTLPPATKSDRSLTDLSLSHAEKSDKGDNECMLN